MALMAPFTFGVLNVVDKMVVERYTPNIYLYAFWIGLLEIPLGVCLLIGFSLDGVDWSAISAGVLLGAIRACSLLMLLAALHHGQLARVAPIYYLNPIMVAPMSAIFLDELLSAIIWGAIVLSVVGAGLVTWQGGNVEPADSWGQRGTLRTAIHRVRGYFSQPKAQAFALIAAFIFASSNVVASRILETEELWDVFAASRIGIGLAMTSASLCIAEVRSDAVRLYRRPGFMGLVLLSEVTASGAIALNLGAIDLGPVSQVSAIGALQPAVILVYSIILMRALPREFPDWVTTSNIPTQVVGVAAISMAVVMIALKG